MSSASRHVEVGRLPGERDVGGSCEMSEGVSRREDEEAGDARGRAQANRAMVA